MWESPRRPAVLLLAGLLTLAAPVVLPATAARADGLGQPFVGDLMDGPAPDTVLLESAQSAGGCRLRIRHDGGDLVTVHTYLALPSGQPCPDLGTAANLDGTGRDELVLTWFAGPPPGALDNLLVLAGLRPVRWGHGLDQPSYIDSGHFNADGYEDVYEWTDQGDGFVTYLSNGRYALAPGPERWCANPRQVRLRSFQRDPALDALISYTERCDDYSSGVVVILDDGRSQVLQNDPAGERIWWTSVVYYDADRYPDVRTVDTSTGAVTYFVNTGSGTFVRVSGAVPAGRRR
ncbi:MAG TPA: hypothetical protein VGD43_16625 [Micromonospora sp.]